MKRPVALLSAVIVTALAVAAVAVGDSAGPITFEPPAYSVGNINGQNGWMKTGPYDAAVVATSSFAAAAGYGFGTQSLRISNAATSGSFGDQTFAPHVSTAAGEASTLNHFDATFQIGTALATLQPGLSLSVSPDNGSGGRMSYLRFDDEADGVHVFFDDVTDAGPVGTAATFNDHDIATLDRAHSHTIRFSIDFVPGPGNDVVKIYIDGALKATGTTWENYYRYDPEQTPSGNVVPTTSTLLFRAGGTAAPGTNGNGYLIDNVSYASSTATVPPTGNNPCKHGGWKTFSDPSFKNEGRCISHMHHPSHHGGPKPEKHKGGHPAGNHDKTFGHSGRGHGKSDGSNGKSGKR
jgi:hypothetical protein